MNRKGDRSNGSMEYRATAKVNLFLKVLGRRPDGYHDIETVYQSVGLADRLRIEVADKGIDLKCEGVEVPAGPENLVFRAAELMQRRFPGRVGGLHIVLEKRIPIGSGLGGGSADAATTLKACNELFQLELTGERLRDLGAELGMDVPFLIEGGRAIGRERGERLQDLPVHGPGWVVVVVPDVSISTRWAYDRLDQGESVESPPLETFVARLEDKSLTVWARLCHNSFEAVVFRAYPELAALKDRLRELGCSGAVLSGSGAAVVGLTDDRERAAWIARNFTGSFRLVEAVAFDTGANAIGTDGLCKV